MEYVYASFNRFEIRLDMADALECSRPGVDASDAVEELAKKEYVRSQFTLDGRLNPAAIRAELQEYGAWDAEELADDQANIQRILWSASCYIRENEFYSEEYEIDGASPADYAARWGDETADGALFYNCSHQPYPGDVIGNPEWTADNWREFSLAIGRLINEIRSVDGTYSCCTQWDADNLAKLRRWADRQHTD